MAKNNERIESKEEFRKRTKEQYRLKLTEGMSKQEIEALQRQYSGRDYDLLYGEVETYNGIGEALTKAGDRINKELLSIVGIDYDA